MATNPPTAVNHAPTGACITNVVNRGSSAPGTSVARVSTSSGTLAAIATALRAHRAITTRRAIR
ncbi:MAG: hypothetical protein ACRDQ7_17790 [Haloechinothrix sp.]